MRITDYMEGKDGSFYSYTHGKGLQKQFSGVSISNGLTWNRKKNVMYYIDSVCGTVDALDYDGSEIAGERPNF